MSVVPFMVEIALAASSSDAISTKPNPLDLPVAWSTISVTDRTSPIFENASRKSSSWVLYDKFPTYSFFAMMPPYDLKFTLTVVRTASVHYFLGHSPQPHGIHGFAGVTGRAASFANQARCRFFRREKVSAGEVSDR
jgi:hypothetical protein